jgi:hypothetical protein
MIRPNRRNVIAAAVSACTAGFALDRIRGSADRRGLQDKGGPRSPVAIVKSPGYSGELAQRIIAGIGQCGRAVKGKRVILKPNLVEFDRHTVINTDVAVVTPRPAPSLSLTLVRSTRASHPATPTPYWEAASGACSPSSTGPLSI